VRRNTSGAGLRRPKSALQYRQLRVAGRLPCGDPGWQRYRCAKQFAKPGQIARAIQRTAVVCRFESAVIQRGVHVRGRDVQRLRQMQHALRALVVHQHAIDIEQEKVDPHPSSMPLPYPHANPGPRLRHTVAAGRAGCCLEWPSNLQETR